MTIRFPPPPNSSDLNSPIWRDWFYKLSLAVSRAYEVATSPAVEGMAHGTFPMSGMNGEVQEGDVDVVIPMPSPTVVSKVQEAQLSPIFFFITDDPVSDYVGPPWTM